MNKYRKFSVTFACSSRSQCTLETLAFAAWSLPDEFLGSRCNAKSSKKMWIYREKKHTNTHNSFAETTINTVQKDWDKNKSEIQEESK